MHIQTTPAFQRIAFIWVRICIVLLITVQLIPNFAAPIVVAADISDTYDWETLNIGGGGFVTGLVLHPTTPDIVYARTDVGGAFKWDEDSQTWSQLILSNRIPDPVKPDYNVESIAISASNDQVVYVAVGEDHSSADGVGRILKSTDQGQSWTNSGQRWWMQGNGAFRTGGERLAVDPNNGDIVYFGSRRQGLWRSTDGGTTWSQIATNQIPVGTNDNTSAGVKFVLFDPTSDTVDGTTERIYAGVAEEGIYRSDDAGTTWTKILTTDQIPYDAEVASDSTLYVGITPPSGVGSVQKYTPDTDTWNDISPSDQSYWEIAIDPANPQRLFAAPAGVADQRFYRSTDGGSSWDALDIALASPDIPWILATDEDNYMSSASIALDPHTSDKLWFPQGTGVWRTTDINDAEVTWTFVSKGIEEMVTTDVIAPPGGVPITAVYDRQGFYHPDLDAYPQQPLLDQEFWGGTSLDYSGETPSFLVNAQVKNNYFPELTGRGAYSRDGGKTWKAFLAKPADSIGGNIAVSATDPNTMVWLPSTGDFGEGKVPYYSNDLGNSWQQGSGITSVNTHPLFWLARKTALTADKVLGDTFYVITFDNDGEFFVSNDGGANFTQAAHAPTCSSNNDCHVFGQLHAVPGYASHVWSSDAKGGLWYTTDAGTTPWSKIEAVQEADTFGFGKAIGDSDYPTIYMRGKINDENGIWRSSDQGTSWDKITDYPANIYNDINVLKGDMNIAGRVYVGFAGTSFVYGDDTTLPAEAPSAPNIIDAIPADGTVQLSWGAVIGATGYKVKYGTTSGEYDQTVDVHNTTSFSAEGLSNGTTYYFTVVAYNEQGDGPNAKEKSARPTSDVPTAPILATPEIDETTVTLNWSAVESATGYKVQYGRMSGNYTSVIDANDRTTYQIAGLNRGATYYITIVAYNGNGDSPASNEERVTIPGADPNQIRAYQVKTAPTLDGRLTEGDWDITIPISKTVSGAVDNESAFGLTWDDTYLYVGVQVLDDDLHNDSDNAWEDDSIEIYIDGNDDRAPSYDPLVDRQFVIGWNDTDLWEQHDQTTGVEYATSDIDGGYSVELAIPWSTLNITLTTDTRFGLDVAINDDDDGKQRDGQNVAFGTENNWNSLADVATVRLFEQPVQTGIRIWLPIVAQ